MYYDVSSMWFQAMWIQFFPYFSVNLIIKKMKLKDAHTELNMCDQVAIFTQL